MAEHIIDSFVSDEAKKQITELASTISTLATSLEKLENVNKTITKKGSNTAKFNAVEEAEKRILKLERELEVIRTTEANQILQLQHQRKAEIAQKKENLGLISKIATAKKQAISQTQTEIANQRALNEVEKLNGIIKAENTTHLQKMDAQMRLLNIELQKLVANGKTESQEYLTKIASLKKLSQEYEISAKASGNMQMKTKSMYGATFSLTQIMRELPNFAISSRIGFMSLSNNIPMLVDNFTMLSKSIDETTGKTLGTKGALKIFAQSLLSVNTILIVASTLLILFGDDIGKFASKLFKGKNAVDDFTDSTKAMITVLDEQMGRVKSNIEAVYELGAMIKRYKQFGDSAEASVKKYNETLGIHHGKLTDINDVMKAYEKYAKKYIDWNIAMEASMLRVSEAAKLRAGIESSQTKQSERALISKTGLKLTPKILSDIDTQLNAYLFRKEGTSALSDTKMQMYLKDLEEDNQMISRFAEEVSIVQAKMFQQTGITVKSEDVSYIMSQRLSENLSKKRMDTVIKSIEALYPEQYVDENDAGSGSGAGGRRAGALKDVLVEEEMYIAELARLKERQVKVDEDMRNFSLDGERQWFEERQVANDEYLANQRRIAELERYIAEHNAEEKRRTEETRIKDAIQHNIKNLALAKENVANNKMSNDDYFAYEKEFIEKQSLNYESLKNNADNHSKEMLRIEDDYIMKNINSLNTWRDTTNKIYEESFAYKKSLIDDDLRREQSDADFSKTKDDVEVQRLSKFEEFLTQASGYSRRSNFKLLEIQSQYNEEKYTREVNAINELIALRKKEGLDTMDLEVQLSKMQSDRSLQLDKEKFDKEKAQLDLQAELRIETEKAVLDTVEALWNSFHERYYAKLKKSKEQYAKIEKEALEDTTDKEKAGVITKEQSEKRKAELQSYYQSVQEQLDRDKEKQERRKFLFEQAMAIARIWTNYAVNASATGLEPITKALLLGLAISQTALVSAQSVPYFAEGGVMEHTGKAVLGDGGKSEFVLRPDGTFFLSKDEPTMYNLEKGTKIYPDANKIDIDSLMRLNHQSQRPIKDMTMINEIKKTNKLLSNQKTPTFVGMPLIRQMQFGQNYAGRKRGLIN